MDNIIFLISKAYEEDEIGQQIPISTQRGIYCTIEDIKQNEFYNAGLSGFKPELSAVVFTFEYFGESEAVIDEEHYSIYRTYSRKDGRTELYLTKKVGGKL